jgi:hypothetical protein
VLTHDSADFRPTVEGESSDAMRLRPTAPRGRSPGFPVEVCERTLACTRAGVAPAASLPRGAAELGQLQDHYHQNDNDQDPDDDSNDSSVHFASSILVRTRNFQIRPLNANCR